MRQVGLWIALIATSLTWTTETLAQNAEPSRSSEYEIKAGYIFNFAKFVEWPARSFARPDSPIVIGVLRNDSFASVLDVVVAGKKIEKRPLVVKPLKWGQEVRDCKCNILVVTTSEKPHEEEVIQLLKGTSVLTISETPGFARRGGMINFTIVDSKVRFEVNVEAAKQAELNISSRLLSLATIVPANAVSR